jgi:guanyl-specific ribonuclease Sa/RNAse (barnase) inhibitor barstar
MHRAAHRRYSACTTLARPCPCATPAADHRHRPAAARPGRQPFPAAATSAAVRAGPAGHAARAPATASPGKASGLPAFLPAEARATIALIQRGGPFPHRQDGSTFGNREQQLPQRARGYYREYTVDTPAHAPWHAPHRHRRRSAGGVVLHRRPLRIIPQLHRTGPGSAVMSHDDFGLGLHDINNAGVYAIDSDDIGALAAAMRDAGLKVIRIDLEGVADKRTLLARLAAQLDFPAGFGGNWDALSDNLRDLQWLPANGYALFLADVDALRAATQKDFDTLLDVMDEASRDWVGRDVPFWVFLSQSA